MACSEHTALNLRSVIGLPVIILLDNNQRNGLHLLIGSETLTTLITDPSSSDGVVLLSRSGIYNSGILVIAKWTLH